MQSVVAPIKETNMNLASEEAPLSFARKVCGLRYCVAVGPWKTRLTS
jgi:hypothetical protein